MSLTPRRKLLTVVVRGVHSPMPQRGEKVDLCLDGENVTEGRVYQFLDYGVLRVEVIGKLPEVFK